ncbi:hypothetical protein ACNH6B_13820 [Shewanella basaltis]|uniref:hypothetical protein n=1 Tax=Shewanella basaltis TaxID=472183 RepID=UPI003AAACC82
MIKLVLLVVILFSIMTDIPFFGVNSIFLASFFIYYGCLKPAHFVFSCSFLLALFCLNSLFAGSMLLSFSLSSFLQFMCSIVVFLGIRTFLLEKINLDLLTKVLNLSIFFVSISILVQCFGLDLGFFEFIRKILLPSVYNNSDMLARDSLINLSGTIRPTLISKESSFISVYVFLIVATLFMIERKRNYINYIFSVAVCVIFNTSPLIVWLFMLLSILYFYNLPNIRFSRLVFYGIIICISFYLIMPILFVRIENATGIPIGFGNFLAVISSGVIPVESSLSVRIINPFLTTLDVLKVNFFFGAGFGNENFILSNSRLLSDNINIVLNNGFASGLTYLGVVGFTCLLIFLSNAIKLNVFFLCLVISIVFFAGGGFTTMRLWAMLSIFTVAFEIYKKKLVRNT